MPFRTVWTEQGLIRHFHGSISHTDLQRAQKQLYEHHRFAYLHYVINDYTDAQPEATINELSIELASELASGEACFNRNLRFAFVATETRMISLLQHLHSDRLAQAACQIPFEIFPTLADARQWAESPGWRNKKLRHVTD